MSKFDLWIDAMNMALLIWWVCWQVPTDINHNKVYSDTADSLLLIAIQQVDSINDLRWEILTNEDSTCLRIEPKLIRADGPQ